MEKTGHDPIFAEVRAARDQHAARFDYDVNEIFRDIQAKQQSSGRKYVRYASRSAVTTRAGSSSA